MAMANVEEVQPRKGPSLVVQAGMLGLATVAAIGLGWLSGAYLKGQEEPARPAVSTEAAAPAAEHGTGGAPAGSVLVQLAPIVTNLAAPTEVWVRLEASLVLDEAQSQELSEQIHQDLLAYLRTLKMHQVEGASGYLHLKADLRERAAIRSGGHVRDVLIRTLLFE